MSDTRLAASAMRSAATEASAFRRTGEARSAGSGLLRQSRSGKQP
jgi:hypothetical protein